MINTSNEYKRLIRQNRIFEPIASITLADATVLNLVKSDFMENGITISDGVTKSGQFTIGSAIINSLSLSLNNFDGKFNQYDFEGAVIRPSIGLKLSATTEQIPKGVFTVDTSQTVGSVINIMSYDNMIKLDRPFSEVSVSYPITALALLQAICTHCSVPLLTTTFTNSSYSITRAIDDEATTCREVLIYIAQLAGCFARCNKDGYLELKWFDTSVFDNDIIQAGTFDNPATDEIQAGTFTNPATDIIQAGEFTDLAKFHTFYSLGSMSVATDDILITGVQVTAMGTDTDYGETATFGTAGYILSIEDNPLIIEGKATEIANSVGAKVVGMRFRPCEFTAMSDPSAEAGDVGRLIDRKANTYQILVTNSKLKVGTRQQFSCDAETPTKRQSGRTDPTTKAIIEARKNTQQQLTTYDLMMQQITATVANGMGLYQSSIGDDYAGRIYYTHDKPTMAESVKRWFYSGGGYVQQTRPTVADEWVTTSGVDVYGNALYNTIEAKGINCDWLTGNTITGKNIISPWGENGRIEMDNGQLKMINDAGKDAAHLGWVVIGASESMPYLALNNTVESFGIGTTSDYETLSTIYSYTFAELMHSFVGDISARGDVLASGDVSATGNVSAGGTIKLTNNNFTVASDGAINSHSNILCDYLDTREGIGGSFTTADGKTVTVQGSLIRSIT